MSTRSTTHLGYGDPTAGTFRPTAIVYRHPDGYPDGHGKDLLKFFDDVEKNCPDTRFGDASYLAAKLVVWLADMFAVDYDNKTNTWNPTHPLNFISVGVVLEDPGDIEYRYLISCDNGYGISGRPKVWVTDVYDNKTVTLDDALKGALS